MKETPYELLEDDQKKKIGKNNEAKMTLYNALPRKEYKRVFMCKTANEVWHTVIITHQGNSQVKNCKIDLLTQEYEKFSISNEETIDSGFTRFNAIVTSLKPLDPDYSTKNHVYKIILENDGVVSKTTTKDKVKSLALKAKVTREKTRDDSDSQGGSDEDIDEEEAEAFNLFGRGRENSFGNKGGESSKPKRACYNCGIEGHFAIECRKPKENKAFVCLKCDLLPDDWIVDSGCAKHMTGNRRLFTLYKACDGRHVIFGNNLKGKIIGGGNITHDFITITNVEYVSGLAFNLINVGQLCDDDYVVSFTKVDCTISKNGKTLPKGNRRNNLYTCKLGDNSKQQICLASVVDNLTLWHKRLGHANMRLVPNLAYNELVRNLPKLSFERHFCDTCGLGSQGNANNRTTNEASTSMVLELLHLDLFGPSPIQSMEGTSTL
ncbi:retrovirus-related pol polyprotein from transposon TNT 1-94 [Tanacetum coccineum]